MGKKALLSPRRPHFCSVTGVTISIVTEWFSLFCLRPALREARQGSKEASFRCDSPESITFFGKSVFFRLFEARNCLDSYGRATPFLACNWRDYFNSHRVVFTFSGFFSCYHLRGVGGGVTHYPLPGDPLGGPGRGELRPNTNRVTQGGRAEGEIDACQN